MAVFYVFIGSFIEIWYLYFLFIYLFIYLCIYLFILGDINSDSFFLIQFFHDIDGWLFKDVSNIEYEKPKKRLELCSPNAFEAMRCSG